MTDFFAWANCKRCKVYMYYADTQWATCTVFEYKILVLDNNLIKTFFFVILQQSNLKYAEFVMRIMKVLL